MEPLLSHHDLRHAMLRDELRLIDERSRLPRPEREPRRRGAALARRWSLRLHLRRAPREQLNELFG